MLLGLRRWLLAPLVDRVEQLVALIDQVEHRAITIANNVSGLLSELRCSIYPTSVILLWTDHGEAPRSTSITMWLAPGETQQRDFSLFQPVSRGAWVVTQGPAKLASVHVSNQSQDMGGASYAGIVCVLADDVTLGTRLSVTLKQPEKGSAYRS